MPEKFIVYAWARTGSYHLVSLLDSCDDVVCHGELFKPSRIELRSRLRSKISVVTPEDRDAAPFKYIKKVRDLTPNKHFGFKIFPSHIKRVPRLRQVLIGDEWKIIGLFRDPIETYASTLRISKTNIWTLRRGVAFPDAEKLHEVVRFSIDTFEKFANGYTGFLEQLRELAERKRNRFFVIGYDQLSEAAVMDKLLDFIGSRSRFKSLHSEYIKQFSKPLNEAFENWDELSRYLQDNPLFSAAPTPSVVGRAIEAIGTSPVTNTRWSAWRSSFARRSAPGG